ncbi:ATP-binding protein [Streptomyces sp. RS10V-4]|uniref:ATP-binding protein n=1 Tax=Streptomyces rhizoryzae TaxID=2932493 RepID=UPI002003C928|nr:ATP-binding protein [Streptomyces rhizoryzae]MCK7623749.1 ATP-binding protein [Streptomyces rhizoryzae]
MNQAHQPTSDLTLAATPNAVSWARRHTVDVLHRWQLRSEVVETARLLVSELTTNAVRHGCPAPEVAPAGSCMAGTISLVLRLTGSCVLILVSDCTPRPPSRRVADSNAICGRGLLLTEAMSSRWGYYHPPRHGGKVVWAEVSIQPGGLGE